MNPKVKKKWVEALRSGEYQQGVGTLRFNGAYCCLGVLCDIYRKEVGGEWSKRRGFHDVLGFSNAAQLTGAVAEWAGLETLNPELGPLDCVTHNDSKKSSFKEIANLIEEYL